jgi:hypothetical protein
MARYLEAFAVDPDALYYAERHGVPSSLREETRTYERRRRARRLTLARMMAGFTTAKLAANTYDFNEQNYYSHESGRHGFSDDLSDVYGLAFGVSPRWLQLGEGPSGLAAGPDAEALAASIDVFVASYDDRIPDELMRFVSTARRALPAAVAELLSNKRSASALPKATTTAGGALEIVREGIGEGKSNVWGFPTGFLSTVWGLSPANLRVVALSSVPPSAVAGVDDRVLIDVDDLSFVDGAEMAVRSGDGTIRTLASPSTGSTEIETLGRVVARISGVP